MLRLLRCSSSERRRIAGQRCDNGAFAEIDKSLRKGGAGEGGHHHFVPGSTYLTKIAMLVKVGLQTQHLVVTEREFRLSCINPALGVRYYPRIQYVSRFPSDSQPKH